MHKSTNIFSEIGEFFKENDASKAMYTIMHILNGIPLSEKNLFKEVSKCNCKMTQLQVLQLLLLFPCFMLKNAFNYGSSSLGNLIGCRKDVFYRFLSNDDHDWRKILGMFSRRLWNKIQRDSPNDGSPVCLMVDDTDFPKRGNRTELIGKVFSHVTHKMTLGFKALFLGITDGKSQMLLDYALVGEEGKSGMYGLRQDQLDNRFSKEHSADCALSKRIEEYDTGKITLMVEMVKRVIKSRIKFDYILADSWFACAEIIRFVCSRHTKCHYLGMVKMSKTKYGYEGKEYTAKALVSKFDHPKKGRKYSRALGCYYIPVDVMFAGHKVRLFFTRRNKHGKWCALITTNTSLSFFEAYRIYSMRWSLEVVFKESKQNLGLGKYQMRNFSSQIACTAITAMQYNILSAAKRFTDYNTIGGLFKEAVGRSEELSVTERIWNALVELVSEIAKCFGIEDENIFDLLVNRIDKLNHFVKFYQLRNAS